jgi:hypothetical protein
VDKTAVVRSDLETRGLIQNALSLAAIPVTLVDVDYIPQLGEWQIFVATPLYDSKGPKEANRRVIKAFQDVGVYQGVPIRRVFVKSPNDSTVKELEAAVKEKREGAIHILESSRSKSERYSVIFAPFAGPGGAVPSRRFDSLENLRAFLEEEIGVSRSSVDEAFSDIRREHSASIFNVHLTRREAKKLFLA